MFFFFPFFIFASPRYYYYYYYFVMRIVQLLGRGSNPPPHSLPTLVEFAIQDEWFF